MAVSGVSSLGMILAYGAFTSVDTLPTAVTELGRINGVGGIELSQEAIDSSALTDKITQYVPGRSDTGGEWTVTVNVTNDTITAWESIKDSTKWFEVYHPDLSKGWFIVASVPAKLPMPEVGQNELLTMEISLVVQAYHGLDTKVAIATTP